MSLNALAEILQKLQSRSPKLREKIYEQQVLETWVKAVGEDLAKHAIASKYENKTLTLRCDHPAWQNELNLNQAKLIEKINAALLKNEATRNGPKVEKLIFKSPARERSRSSYQPSWPKRKTESR